MPLELAHRLEPEIRGQELSGEHFDYQVATSRHRRHLNDLNPPCHVQCLHPVNTLKYPIKPDMKSNSKAVRNHQ